MTLLIEASAPIIGNITNNWTPVNCPAHKPGDLILLIGSVRTALVNRGTVPPTHIRSPEATYAAGWQYVAGWADGSSTSPGTDNGPMATFVYGKVATTTSEAMPQLQSGNLFMYRFFVFRPPAGYKWADVVDGVIDSGIAKFVGDQAAASPLEGTATSWTNPPTTNDEIIEFGAIPTDSSVNPAGASTLTVPGLSGGTKTPVYYESGSGQDGGSEWIHWKNFTGTASGPPSASHPFAATAGSQNTGVIVFVAIRITDDGIAPYNLLENGTFDAGISPWSGSQSTQAWNSVDGHDGPGSLEATAVGTGTQSFGSELISCLPGQPFSTDMWFKSVDGTPGQAAVDFQFYQDDGTTLVSTVNGPNSLMESGLWGQRVNENVVAPALGEFVRVRSRTTGNVVGQKWRIDDVRLFQDTALPTEDTSSQFSMILGEVEVPVELTLVLDGVEVPLASAGLVVGGFENELNL